MTVATFEQPDVLQLLEKGNSAELDLLDFGVIGMDSNNNVQTYNTTEAKFAGLTRENVLGANLFTTVAPCMNNFMVAQRFEDALASGQDLDVTIDYVLTLRMRPKQVRLRLLARHGSALRYVLIKPA